MAWGYGPNDIAASFYLTLFTQAVVFLALLTPWFRTKTGLLSQTTLTLWGLLVITGSTALYHWVFPLESGVSSGLGTLLFVAPSTIVNTWIFAFRAALRLQNPGLAPETRPETSDEESRNPFQRKMPPTRSWGNLILPFVTVPINCAYWWLLLFA